MTEELHTYYCKDCFKKQERIDKLEQENKELKKQHYEALKMLKHEYNSRQRDNEQWFTRCTENHNEDSKIIEKYRSALEEIREILQKPDLPLPDEDNLMTATELLIVVDANRQKKLMNIQDKINEVLNEKEL